MKRCLFLREGENINLMLTLVIIVDPVLEFECIYNKRNPF